MKRLHRILWILGLVLGLVACSNDNGAGDGNDASSAVDTTGPADMWLPPMDTADEDIAAEDTGNNDSTDSGDEDTALMDAVSPDIEDTTLVDAGTPDATATDTAPEDIALEDTAPDIPTPPDKDGDGVPDSEDNCVDVPNPLQVNTDGDDDGNACDPDQDNDGVPNELDLDPTNWELPGTVQKNYVYAHTSSKLFTMHIKTYAVTLVGPFKKSSGSSLSSVTDIAIDRFGVLYAVTFGDLYTCHPETAVCTLITSLPSTSFNGLTLIPKGLIKPDQDTLVGIANNGGWYQIDLTLPTATLTKLGSYGAGYSSSGDAFSIEDVGTFAAVNKSGQSKDYLVSLDPLTGSVIAEIGPIGTYGSIFGLAGSSQSAFAFNSGGEILEVDLTDGTTTLIKDTNNGWWGAGVTTRF